MPVVHGKDFRLADEIGYIQDKAADHVRRMVTIGQLVLFSTERQAHDGHGTDLQPRWEPAGTGWRL
jgi:hypothetical protein